MPRSLAIRQLRKRFTCAIGPLVSVDSIMNETKSSLTDAVTEGDSDSTHIILLHDAGGDR